MIETLTFYLFSLVLVASALLVVFAKNPVHSVLFLILAFFNSAALFLLLGAEFIAMILVIVYVGAVAVLFLFVVMMLDIDFAALRGRLVSYLPVGLLVGVVFLAEIFVLFSDFQLREIAVSLAQSDSAGAQQSVSNTQAIGQVLYTDYFYLFQLSGMILLLAMVSAIVLTLRHRGGVRRQDPAKQSQRTRAETIEIKKVEKGAGV